MKKYFEKLTDDVVSVLSDGEFPIDDKERWNKFYNDVERDRVLAIIECENIDIELEMWTGEGNSFDDADENDKKISLSYFVCIKENGTWISDDFIDTEVNVDFSNPNWEIELENDMCNSLNAYIKESGYSFL